MTQQQVAELIGVTQESVSQIERREDIFLSTLGKYIRALGGELELTAIFGDRRVQLLTALEAQRRREAGETSSTSA